MTRFCKISLTTIVLLGLFLALADHLTLKQALSKALLTPNPSKFLLCGSRNLEGAADGFATVNGMTTGGAGGPTVTVTTAADLDFYGTQPGPYIIQIQGTIDLSNLANSLHATSNKTFVGLGANATVIGGFGFYGVSNIIVQNLTITNSINVGEGDGITIKNAAHHIWVDHCTLFDCPDGEIDITVGSDYVTISWCKFYYTVNTSHDFVNLIGASDSDSGNYYVTFHHNWWSTLCVERMPSVRFGHAHIYNNYYNTPGNNYNIRVRIASECLIENNYFEGL